MSEEVKKIKNIKQRGKSKHSELNKIKFSNKDLYSFYNIKTKEKFIGTRYELQKKYNLSYKGIYLIVNKINKSHKNWVLYNE